MKSKRIIAVLSMSLMLFSMGCSSASQWKDGTYEGVGAGLQDDIKVQVTVSGGKISKVDVLEHQESPGVSDPALLKIPAAIIEEQTFEVDTISGVTYTSDGIKDAVEEALNQAK